MRDTSPLPGDFRFFVVCDVAEEVEVAVGSTAAVSSSSCAAIDASATVCNSFTFVTGVPGSFALVSIEVE